MKDVKLGLFCDLNERCDPRRETAEACEKQPLHKSDLVKISS